MSPTEPAVERRQHARVPVRGTVVVQGAHPIHGRITTLSDVALDILCELDFETIGANMPIEFTLELDGTDIEVHLTGRVRLVRTATNTLVITYDPAPELARAVAEHLPESDAARNLQLMALTRDRDDVERQRVDDRDRQSVVDERRRQEPS